MCANNTKKFANYWVHNNFITMSKEKMAKSQGNILKISDLKEKYNGQVLRLALISAHYSQPLDWNEKLMDECQRTLDKWYNCYVPVNTKVLMKDDDLKPLYDDLNTPGFIAVLHKLYDKAKDGNKEDKELFTTACKFIGLFGQSKDEWNSFKKQNVTLSENDILNKIDEKNLLNFYLSSVTIKDFNYKPTAKTKKEIWRYLNSANLIKLDDIPVEDVMTPRSVIFALQKDSTVGQVIGTHSPIAFSRIPVFDNDLDNIVGIVSLSLIHI